MSEIKTEDEDGLEVENHITLCGMRSKIIEAPEPTNVIWENRDFNKKIRVKRLVYVIFCVIFVLFITFMATVQAKVVSNDLIGKYDESMNCQ